MGALILANRHNGERLEISPVAGSEDLMIRGTLPPRRPGPPMHVHHHALEEGRVLEGRLSVEVDGRVSHIRPARCTGAPPS